MFWRLVNSKELDVVLMDLNYARDTTSGSEGLDLLTRIQAVDPTLAGGGDDCLGQRRSGRRSDAPRRARLYSKAMGQRATARGGAVPKLNWPQRCGAGNVWKQRTWPCATARLTELQSKPSIVAESPAMKSVLKLVERIGPADANILITGENGTGKGVIARAVHSTSRALNKPLVSLNAGALAEGVFESELFGHVRGAFTDAKTDRVGRFELADGGTLFLDEIANVPLTLQPKLLRVLETGEFERVGSSKTQKVDVRVLSATNADLTCRSRAGKISSGFVVPAEHG